MRFINKLTDHCGNFKSVIIFKLILQIDILSTSKVIGTGLPQRQVNNVLGNGLVPSGNKPLPETMLTRI